MSLAGRDVYGDKRKLKKEMLDGYREMFMHKPNRSAVGRIPKEEVPERFAADCIEFIEKP